MELRHLRCFVVVAEELNFTRAAERLHIEQSPLSRTIRQLEEDLGVQLFERNNQGARLTWPGQVFLDDARRILSTVEQARDSARTAAAGYHGLLRIALSDGIAQPQMSALLAHCREEAPEVEIRLFEMPLAQQLKELRDGLYDVGLAKTGTPGDGLVATPVWEEAIIAAVPARHPLLAYPELALSRLVQYPLILCDPDTCEGCRRQIDDILRNGPQEPEVAEVVASHDLMMTLVAAGYGVGLTTQAQLEIWNHPEVISRPLAGEPPVLVTYLLHRDVAPSAQLEQFIERALEDIGPPQ